MIATAASENTGSSWWGAIVNREEVSAARVERAPKGSLAVVTILQDLLGRACDLATMWLGLVWHDSLGPLPADR